MFDAIFDLWYTLPSILRVILGLILIGISALVFFAAGRIWIWPAAIGLVLLMFSVAGKNKDGYNF